jgi:hypothetical protein
MSSLSSAAYSGVVPLSHVVPFYPIVELRDNGESWGCILLRCLNYTYWQIGFRIFVLHTLFGRGAPDDYFLPFAFIQVDGGM